MFISGKLFDLLKKVAMFEPVIKFVSAKNEMFMNKVSILTVEAENYERMVVLEKSLQVGKGFCKLKDKQIGDLELKLQKVEAMAVKEFKDSNEYSDELCGYYTWMALTFLGSGWQSITLTWTCLVWLWMRLRRSSWLIVPPRL